MTEENRPNSAVCPSCRQRVPVRKDGTFVDHKQKKPQYPLKTTAACAQSNKSASAVGV